MDERLVEREPKRDGLVERRKLAPDAGLDRTPADLEKAGLELCQLSAELGSRLGPRVPVETFEGAGAGLVCPLLLAAAAKGVAEPGRADDVRARSPGSHRASAAGGGAEKGDLEAVCHQLALL